MYKVTELSSYRNKLIMATIFVIIIASSFVTYSFNIGYRMTSTYTPLVDAAMEIKLEATNAHLWFEEVLSGDSDEDIKTVYQYIDNSIWYANAMINGGKNTEGIFIALDNKELISEVQNILKELNDYKKITAQRLKEKKSFAGSDYDKDFDKKFKAFIKHADVIETKLQNIISDELKSYKQTYFIILLGILLMSISGAIILYRYEKNRINILITLEKALEEQKQLQIQSQQKDRLVYQQSKMASMGEMIGNIAHQWRQPISIISMWANNIIADIDMEDVDNKSLTKYANNINKQTKHLSQTIDDFRNFFVPNKDVSQFTLKDSMDKTMSLMKASFKTHNIEVIESTEDIEITALENELTQALLNIIKNAKDILLVLPDNKRKLILIDIYKKDNSAIIEIKDSGGGIADNIIDKVFEPYFTTKHKAQGTGIGLYMTESIITKHLNGEISVSNEEFEYANKQYKGARFLIKLAPL